MMISKFLGNSHMEGYGMYGDKQTFSKQMKNASIKYLKYTVLQKNPLPYIHVFSVELS